MRRTLFLGWLGLAMPLWAASPEYLVGGTASAPAPGFRGNASAATDGTDFFVIWSDARSGAQTLIGTRVTRAGQVLDPLGIRIASSASFITAPHVVWDGGAYLVIWTDTRFDGGSSGFENDIHAARIGRDGHIVMAPRLLAADATSRGRYAASNGNVTVIAYRRRTDPAPVRVRVLDREANTLRDDALPGPEAGYYSSLAVAATPSRFVVTWHSDPGPGWYDEVVNAVALDSGGRVASGPVQIGSGIDPAIATDGTGFAITSVKYLDREIDPEWLIVSRTVSADLTQIGEETPLTSANTIESVSLLWRGDRYEMLAGSMQESGTPYLFLSVELDAGGHKLASRTRGAGLNPYWISISPVAITNGSDVLVAFNSFAGDAAQHVEVFAQIYRGGSAKFDVQQLLSWSGNAHEDPDITSSAAGYFAAWTDTDGVYATRIDTQGRSLDGRGIRLTGFPGRARVTFDGTNYVVAWIDAGHIAVRYIAPASGATVAEVHLPATNVWQYLALAASPEATYVVIAEERIRVTRIPSATHIADPVPLTVSPEFMTVGDPDAAWNGSALLIVWDEIYYVPRADPPFPLAIKIHGARVTAGLTLLDPAPLLIGAFPETELGSFGVPSVASNGEDWLVVTDLGPHVEKNSIVARRVLRSGVVEGADVTTIGEGFAPDVAWDGTRYAVAFKGGDNAGRAGEEPVLMGSVAASGALVPMRRTLVSTKTAPSVPSVARAANGEVAVAYTKVSFAPEHTGVERSYFRVVDSASRGRVVRR